MTITDRQLAREVGLTMIYPIKGDQLQEKLPGAKEFIDYIAEEVVATEKPSRIAQHPVDGFLRRSVVARVLTMAALHAEDFGEKQEEKRRSRPRNPKPSPN